MEEKWGPQILKKYENKVSGKKLGAQLIKKCFYKVS